MPVARVHLKDILLQEEWQGINTALSALIHEHYHSFLQGNAWLDAGVGPNVKNDAFYRFQHTADADMLPNWVRIFKGQPSFELLTKAVQHVADAMLRQAGAEKLLQQRIKGINSAWASVHCNGSAHGRHTHTGHLLSAVYYAKVPLGTPPLMLDPIVNTIGAEPVPIHVEPGVLVVFPSWAPHEVLPSSGAEERFSISFNLPGSWAEGANLHRETVLEVAPLPR